MLFHCETLQYPPEVIYHSPTFAETGITLQELHHIRAQHFVSAHDHIINDKEKYHQQNRFKLAAFFKLKLEAFPKWNPTDEQVARLNIDKDYISQLPRCNICGLYQGTYCSVPTLPIASWTHMPTLPLAPTPPPKRSEVHPNKYNKRQRKH